jgi:hypothetical protein
VTVNPEEAHGSELRIAVEAKTGRLSASKAQAELASALDNREARAAILVFDGRRDAPLGGRAYCPHPGGKFTVVLDAQEMDPLALEVAAREARRFVIASAVASPLLTTTWLEQQRIRLRDLMEEARLIKRGENDGRRALDRIGGGYADLRARIIEILDDIDNRLAGESADRDAQSA